MINTVSQLVGLMYDPIGSTCLSTSCPGLTVLNIIVKELVLPVSLSASASNNLRRHDYSQNAVDVVLYQVMFRFPV